MFSLFFDRKRSRQTERQGIQQLFAQEDDHLFKDIGMSRAEAEEYFNRPNGNSTYTAFRKIF